MSTCYLVFYFLVVIIILTGIGFYSGSLLHFGEHKNTTNGIKPENSYLSQRKLMLHGKCKSGDISISQSRYPNSGIPLYIVEIVNTCVSKCAPSKIHIHCGWFASARIVNPTNFKRISFDDCLVNEGKPLNNSQIIRFTYANTLMYPLKFKSAEFC